MPRLVSADLFPGRLLTLENVRHRVAGLKDQGATVLLQRDDGSGTVYPISRSELYARIVEERARLLDEIEDPDIVDDQPEINLSFLSTDRKIDWYHKMIIIRGLLSHSRMSPRSAEFRTACERARRLLRWAKVRCEVESTKSWSDKTLNDDLRRWRRSGYAFAAFQVKGLQYRPIEKRRPKYVTARTLIDQIRRAHPLWSIEAVRRMCQHLLRNGVSSYLGKSSAEDSDVEAVAATAVK